MVARLAAKAATKFLKKRATPKAKPKAADKARKEAGREAADLGTPASEARKPGRTYGTEIHKPSRTDVKIARGERLGTMKAVQKRYNDNKKKLEKLKRDVEFLKLKASPGKNKTVMGRHKANQKLKNVKEEIKHLKTSMTDMVKRHNIKKKEGGKVIQKKHGGMTHVGLSPAEEARAGTMPKDKRTRYMQGGGPIHTTFPKRAAPRTEGRETSIDLFPKVERKNSGKVGKQKAAVKKIASRIKGPKQNRKKKKEAGEIGLSPKGTEAVERLKDSKYWAKAVGLPSQLPKVTKAPTKKAKTAPRPDRKLTSLKKGGQVGSMETDGNKYVASYYTKL